MKLWLVEQDPSPRATAADASSVSLKATVGAVVSAHGH
jgi:hypothetical protein